jgi:tyrosyl-tRNA synthetase
MDKIKEILTRGVTDVIEKNHLEKALRGDKKLRIKFGIDPTGPNIHLGHAITYWKLKELQDLGHKIVLIIGDFTAQIGDPSDKESERQPLTFEQVKVYETGYLEQIGHILDLKKCEIRNNSEWHAAGTKQDMIEEAMNFTVNQMIQRDNFEKRLKADKPVSLHELLYPLLQGMDSVAIKSDVELGGNDQYFNLLAGRTLQKRYGQKPQDIITFDLIEGTDGRKMSKSYNNAIYLVDSPDEKFGKVMSVKDELISRYFRLLTDLPLTQVEKIEKQLEDGLNPRDAKVILAKAIVARYHGEKAADEALKNFEQVFVKNELPTEIEEFVVLDKNWQLADLLQFVGLVGSKSEARRLIEQGGVKVDGASIGDREVILKPKAGMIVQVGKRKFAKLKLDK